VTPVSRSEGPDRKLVRHAAVLIPLFRDEEGDIRLVLVRRGPGGVHGGQLAFPGGNREPADVSMLETALREASEEIGLDRDQVTILEELPTFETRTTGYSISSFLARIVPTRPWRPLETEIAEVLEVRIADLLRPGAHDETIEEFPTWKEPQRIVFYRVGPYRLWGLTYRILHPLLPRLVAGAWSV